MRSPLLDRLCHRLIVGVVFTALASSVISTAYAEDGAGDQLEPVAFDATDGAQIESLLSQVGLDAAWRSATGLSEPSRAMVVRYDEAGAAIVNDLVSTAATIASASDQHTIATARLREVAADETAALKWERDRLIDRNRADAHLRGVVNLLRSVAIAMFAGSGDMDDELLGVDGAALRHAQRTVEIRGHTLDEMIDRRAIAIDALRQTTAALDNATASRRELGTEHVAVQAEARELTRVRNELDHHARQILPRAADAFALASVPAGASLSPRAIDSYMNAELLLAESDPGCRISWRTIAAVGAVEGAHGNYGYGELLRDGTSDPRIVGVALDGVGIDSAGETVAAIADTDNGVLDGDAQYDRAVGPMQFIPETWARWALDGDGDGATDPFDLDDASLSAGAYLCSYGSQRSWDTWKAAIFGYNHSPAYVASVKIAHDRIRQVRVPAPKTGPEFEPSAPWGTYVAMPIPTAEDEATDTSIP